MSETNQKEDTDRTAGIQNKLQGRFFLKSDIAKRLLSPWSLYIPFAGVYLAWSFFNIFTLGPYRYVPAFCVPIDRLSSSWCYPAEPMSMVALSLFMVACVPRFGWFSGLIAASAGAGYDLVGGGVRPLLMWGMAQLPVTVFQVVVLFLPFIILRKMIRPRASAIMILYLGLNTSGSLQPLSRLGMFYEPLVIVFFSWALLRSIRRISDTAIP